MFEEISNYVDSKEFSLEREKITNIFDENEIKKLKEFLNFRPGNGTLIKSFRYFKEIIDQKRDLSFKKN